VFDDDDDDESMNINDNIVQKSQAPCLCITASTVPSQWRRVNFYPT